MRIILGLIGVLIALAVIAVVVVAINLNGIVRSSVESQGPTYTGTTVSLEEVDISLFSGEGELRGLVVGQPEGYEGEPAFRLASIRIALEPSSLLEDTILIRELLIDGAEIRALVRGPRENNLQAILDHIESVTGPAAPETEPTASKQVIIDRLALTGSSATARVASLQPVRVAVPDVVLENVGRESNGAQVGAVLQQVLQPVVGAIIRSAVEGGLRDRLDSVRGDLQDRIREGAGGLMDRLGDMSPFGGGSEKETVPEG
jgi:hypothetical protein